jgi:hypothetical protein
MCAPGFFATTSKADRSLLGLMTRRGNEHHPTPWVGRSTDDPSDVGQTDRVRSYTFPGAGYSLATRSRLFSIHGFAKPLDSNNVASASTANCRD